MNAKQLSLMEEKSPHIVPQSDRLWSQLIEKDFPDRPHTADVFSRTKPDATPYRTLYHKYVTEREAFRQDLAKRLRRITQQLQNKKSENKIITVSGILKDPTIKRRTYSSPRGSYGRQTALNKSSILNKARRELQGRNLIFSRQHVKPYSAYDAFKPADNFVYTSRMATRPTLRHTKSSPESQIASQRPYRKPTQFNTMSTQAAVRNAANAAPTTTQSTSSTSASTPTVPSTSDASTNGETSVNTETSLGASVSTVTNALVNDTSKESPIRRRRPQPSIFMTLNKRLRASPIIRKPTKKKDSEPDNPSIRKIRAIKSSIFN